MQTKEITATASITTTASISYFGIGSLTTSALTDKILFLPKFSEKEICFDRMPFKTVKEIIEEIQRRHKRMGEYWAKKH